MFAPLPPPLPPTHVVLNHATVASPPHAETRGVRWPGAQHAQQGRHHPAAGINPEEHGQYSCYARMPTIIVLVRTEKDKQVMLSVAESARWPSQHANANSFRRLLPSI